MALLEQWWGWVIGSKGRLCSIYGVKICHHEKVWKVNVVKRALTMMKILMWSTNFGDKSVLQKKIVRNYKNEFAWWRVGEFLSARKEEA
jgi:hypothetical protein